MLISPTVASELLGIHIQTLREWSDKGLIEHHRTAGKHRRYDYDAIIAYGRAQRLDLKNATAAINRLAVDIGDTTAAQVSPCVRFQFVRDNCACDINVSLELLGSLTAVEARRMLIAQSEAGLARAKAAIPAPEIF